MGFAYKINTFLNGTPSQARALFFYNEAGLRRKKAWFKNLKYYAIRHFFSFSITYRAIGLLQAFLAKFFIFNKYNWAS
jgi:hypothetical protein